jgi:hypothetical protein
MKYIITGETLKTGRNVSPEEFTQVLNKGIILNLEAYNNLGFEQKITPNGTELIKTGVAIIEGESLKEVNKHLDKFPTWMQVKWTVTPFESF